MTELATITLMRNKTMRAAPWHIYRQKDGDAVGGKGICGLTIHEAEWVTDVDYRVVAHAGRPVCGNCLDQLAARLTSSGAAGIVVASPTRGADDRRQNRRNTMGARKQAAKSEPLLEPAEYETQTVERLQAERSTINNRLSGLGTQVKRHLAKNDAEKARVAEERISDLQARRTQLADTIAAKSAAAPGGAEPEPTKRTTAKRTAAPAAKRTTAKRKTATKRKTAKRSTAKRSSAKRKTTATRRRKATTKTK